MKCRMTKELEKLIAKADKKLDEAKDARADVMWYIQEHYGIDTDYHYEKIEDELSWCYGIDTSAVQDLIESKCNSDER